MGVSWDGKEGLIFFFLQTFWFRFLVDAKVFEMKKEQSSGGRHYYELVNILC